MVTGLQGPQDMALQDRLMAEDLPHSKDRKLFPKLYLLTIYLSIKYFARFCDTDFEEMQIT